MAGIGTFDIFRNLRFNNRSTQLARGIVGKNGNSGNQDRILFKVVDRINVGGVCITLVFLHIVRKDELGGKETKRREINGIVFNHRDAVKAVPIGHGAAPAVVDAHLHVGDRLMGGPVNDQP